MASLGALLLISCNSPLLFTRYKLQNYARNGPLTADNSSCGSILFSHCLAIILKIRVLSFLLWHCLFVLAFCYYSSKDRIPFLAFDDRSQFLIVNVVITFSLGPTTDVPCFSDSRADKDDSRCFNCGSYSHALKDCPKPRDNVAISNARKQHNLKRNQSNVNRVQNRYYQKTPGKFDDLKAGVLGPETRQCLGIGVMTISVAV